MYTDMVISSMIYMLTLILIMTLKLILTMIQTCIITTVQILMLIWFYILNMRRTPDTDTGTDTDTVPGTNTRNCTCQHRCYRNAKSTPSSNCRTPADNSKTSPPREVDNNLQMLSRPAQRTSEQRARSGQWFAHDRSQS